VFHDSRRNDRDDLQVTTTRRLRHDVAEFDGFDLPLNWLRRTEHDCLRARCERSNCSFYPVVKRDQLSPRNRVVCHRAAQNSSYGSLTSQSRIVVSARREARSGIRGESDAMYFSLRPRNRRRSLRWLRPRFESTCPVPKDDRTAVRREHEEVNVAFATRQDHAHLPVAVSQSVTPPRRPAPARRVSSGEKATWPTMWPRFRCSRFAR